MKFLCGSCRTKYQISDEKVRGKILTIRCKKCGAKILVRESLGRDTEGGAALAPVAEAAAAPAARTGGSAALAAAYEAGMDQAPTSEADDMPTSIAPVPADAGLAGYEWYVAIDGQQHGPFAYAELVTKVQRQGVVGRHYVWHDGMADWTRVRDLPDLARYLDAAPKSSPPPPPPSEAADNVVDFKAPEAAATIPEQRALHIAEPEIPLADEPEDQTQPAAATADLAEGLSAPEFEAGAAVATPESGAAIASGTVPEGALDVSLDDEDIFANVPRASQSELVQRESTKFFVAAAGVKNEKKKNRVGIIMGLVAASLFLVFMGLWASGIISISLPGLGNPFKGPSETTAVVQNTDGVGAGDFSFLGDEVKVGAAGGKSALKAKVKRRRIPSVGGSRGVPSPGEYIDDGPEERGTRRLAEGQALEPDETVEIGKGGSLGKGEVEITPLPQADLTVPPPEGLDALTPSIIQNVVASKKASVRLCYERSLKAQENLKGKLKVGLRVLPSGKVQNTEILSPEFKGSVVGNCIRKTIRNWKFPAFDGGTQEIELPFVFQSGG